MLTGPVPVGPGQASAGRQLFVDKGCIACHTVTSMPEARGTVGPILDHVASVAVIPPGGPLKNTPENLKRWIMDPQGVKPGDVMPDLDLTSREADDLVAFLETLR